MRLLWEDSREPQTSSIQELIDFGLDIASGKMSKNDIKGWIIEHRK